MGPLTRTAAGTHPGLWGKGSMNNELRNVVLRALGLLLIAVILGIAWGVLGSVMWAMHH